MGVKGLLRNRFVVAEYCFDNPLSPVREFVVKILLTYLELLSSINYYENLIKIRGKSLCWLLVTLWFSSYFTGNSDDVLIIYCEVKFDGDHFWGLREYLKLFKNFYVIYWAAFTLLSMHPTPAPTILSLFETRTLSVPPPEEIGINIGPWHSPCFFNISHKTLLVIISDYELYWYI